MIRVEDNTDFSNFNMSNFIYTMEVQEEGMEVEEEFVQVI